MLQPTAGKVLVQQIKTLRAQGMNADGTMSVPYTKRYSSNRRRGGYQTSHVDHKRTGEYVKSIRYKEDSGEGSVASDLKNQEQVEGLNKRRLDFGVHPSSVKLTEQALTNLWNAS